MSKKRKLPKRLLKRPKRGDESGVEPLEVIGMICKAIYEHDGDPIMALAFAETGVLSPDEQGLEPYAKRWPDRCANWRQSMTRLRSEATKNGPFRPWPEVMELMKRDTSYDGMMTLTMAAMMTGMGVLPDELGKIQMSDVDMDRQEIRLPSTPYSRTP